MSYTKLFKSIITSTIWLEDDKTRIVWITLLALADKYGEVISSVPGLARLAGVSVEEVEKAILTLSSPDLYSRTKYAEGRRVTDIEGGWALLNHEKYRSMASKDELATSNAARQKRFRDRARVETSLKSNAEVTASNDEVTASNEASHDSNGVIAGSNASSPPVTHDRDIEEEEEHSEEKEEEEVASAANAASLTPKGAKENLKVKIAIFSKEGKEYAQLFKALLPETIKLPKNWESAWAKCYDELINLDLRDPEKILEVTKWTRNDNFWGKNFMSPTKLRKRNKENVLYYDVFTEAKKQDRSIAGIKANRAENGYKQDAQTEAKILIPTAEETIDTQPELDSEFFQ